MRDRDTVLQTIALRREYRAGGGTIAALDGIDISISKGEFVAVMGPSGCGKSTLLNLLGGLDQPTAGNVLVDEHDLADLDEEHLAAVRRDKIGFIFQHHDLFPVLTTRENIEFPLLLAGVDRARRRARADALLQMVGLEAEADFMPDELSGGQQQRIGIARALANSAPLLLADEPTGNLDDSTADAVMSDLIALVRTGHLTLVVVTHDAQIAASADRILHLMDGRLTGQKGTLS